MDNVVANAFYTELEKIATFITSPVLRAAQQQLLTRPRVAPRRVAAPLAPAVAPKAAPPLVSVVPAPGIMSTIRRRLFRGGYAPPGLAKTSSDQNWSTVDSFMPVDVEAFRRELHAITS